MFYWDFAYSFRELVHDHHGNRHGIGGVAEILHPGKQAGGRKRETVP